MASFDQSTYQPPGVYVSQESTPLQQVIGVSPSVVALVGPSIGYRLGSETVTLTSTTPVALAELGIDPSSVVVRSIDGTLYTSGDFALVVGAGDDGSTTTDTYDNTTTLARSGGSNIPSGSPVFVEYQFTDADYYAPLRVTDFDDAKDAFGEPFDEDGAIASPLTLAAKFAFANGARELHLVPTAGAGTTTASALLSAYSKLSTLWDVNLIVPIPAGITGTAEAAGDTTTVGSDLKTFIEAEAYQDRLYRVGIVGYETTVTVLPQTLAAAFRSSRIVLAWPNQVTYYNPIINAVQVLSGYYLAAAYAGVLANQSPQMPLTKKQVFGFTTIPAAMQNTMTLTTKNTWSDAGVAVTELSRDQRMLVRHGTTTDRSSMERRELSIVRAKDGVVRLLEDTIEAANLIGTPIDPDTALRVKGVINNCLETALSSGLFVKYRNLKVRQQSVDPSVLEVKFEYVPSYPLNYIAVMFTLNATTGDFLEA